jgi:hypothetical protein
LAFDLASAFLADRRAGLDGEGTAGSDPRAGTGPSYGISGRGEMALYDMTRVKEGLQAPKDSTIKVNRTTFAAENIQERAHLQAALRDHIELIDENLHVVAEEFGDFEGVNRLFGSMRGRGLVGRGGFLRLRAGSVGGSDRRF